jgi:hypothetical protein
MAVERLTISLRDAAIELGVSPDTIMKWVQAGHLPIFVPPGVDQADHRPGPKGYQVFRADWEAFKKRQTFVGGIPMKPLATPVMTPPSGRGIRGMKRPRE